MDACKDVEQLQNVIRTLEVQNEKLRNKSRNGTPVKPLAKSSQNTTEDTDCSSLDVSILSDQEIALPNMYEKNGRENWISCLDDADFEAVGSVTEVLETYDNEIVWELEDVERAKRTAWRIFQKCERKLNEEKVSTNFAHFNDINPLVMPDSPMLTIQSRLKIKQPDEREDTTSTSINKTQIRSRSPMALPRPSQSKLHEERERGRSISPQRRSPSPRGRRGNNGSSPDQLNRTVTKKMSTPVMDRIRIPNDLDLSVIDAGGDRTLERPKRPYDGKTARISVRNQSRSPVRAVHPEAGGTIIKGKRIDDLESADKTFDLGKPVRDRSISKERPLTKRNTVSGLPRPSGLPRLSTRPKTSRIPARPKK